MSKQPVEVLVGERLRQRKLRLALAESCTGGLIGHRITNVPGSSEYFLGSVIAYAYEAKVQLLGVRWETLNQHGAVSQETTLEMARGARQALGADIGLAVSGIAGPGGGTPEKPVGLVWFGLSAPEAERAWRGHWEGDRLQIKEQAAEHALRLLAEFLTPGDWPVEESRMQAIEVKARFDDQGRIIPVSFTWQGRTYLVEAIGRRWQDEAGQHILVMTPGEKVYELALSSAEMQWYLLPVGLDRGTA
ncbi:MAG: CinA family protein [Anaerolineales bacterium]|nr:CinA family protein [Anaerolineales bacterium]